METAIDEARGASPYECIVAFSGGKDSSYTLKLLVEKYKLRCLAVTVDNGFISEQARINAAQVTTSLGVDHTVFKPAPRFMNSLYLKSATVQDIHTPSAIKRASSMCNSCINLINSYVVKTALASDIPLIAGGYIGGQVPRDAAVLQLSVATLQATRSSMLKKFTQTFGHDAPAYFDYGLEASRGGGKVLIINPMLCVRVGEDEIIADIGALGWKRTNDTGKNSSNCRLNDLGILVHARRFGFSPYLMEIADQVRNGLMSREEGLARSRAIPKWEEVEPQAKAIGLRLSDLG
jgi:tRNA(Ile)-lysidine synthase TilS/MesJ